MPPTTPHLQLASPLLSLPREILDRIYEYHLAIDDTDFINTLRPFHVFTQDGDETLARPLPPLMVACKRTYYELRDQVHHGLVLKVHPSDLSVRIGLAFRGTLRYGRLRRLIIVVALQHPYWNRWLPFLEEVVKRSPGLREVVVDWQPIRQVHFSPWDASLYAKKEAAFLGILAGMKDLDRVKLFGVPPHWGERLREMTTVRVVQYPWRWWKEIGRDRFG